MEREFCVNFRGISGDGGGALFGAIFQRWYIFHGTSVNVQMNCLGGCLDPHAGLQVSTVNGCNSVAI